MHTVVIHGQAVANANSRKGERGAAGQPDAGLGRLGDGVQMDVAGYDLVGRIDDANNRAFHLFLGQTEGVEQGTVGSFFQTFFKSKTAHSDFP